MTTFVDHNDNTIPADIIPATPEQAEKRADAWGRLKTAILDLTRDIPTDQLDEWFNDCFMMELCEIQLWLLNDARQP
jgi:hypothetical protein